MTENSYHVILAPKGGWNVKKRGAKRAIKHFQKKDSAIDYGRSSSKKNQGELVIHRKDGTVQEKASHCNDPQQQRSQVVGK